MTQTASTVPGIPFQSIIGAVIAVLILGFCFYILARTCWIWHFQHMRRQGFDPSGKKPTLFDVRELLLKNEKDMAVRLYRQIFKVDQREAQSAVDALQKNLHHQG